jgi:hypothetical protein
MMTFLLSKNSYRHLYVLNVVCVSEREKERERERERIVYYNIYTMNSKDRKNSKKMRK